MIEQIKISFTGRDDVTLLPLPHLNMACSCSTCARISKHTLAELPDHPRKGELILHLCRIHLAALDDHCFNFSKSPLDFGMPGGFDAHEGVAAIFHSTVRAYGRETKCAGFIWRSPPAYQFDWDPRQTRQVVQSVVAIAQEWTTRNNQIKDLTARKKEQRHVLLNLAGPNPREAKHLRQMVHMQWQVLPGFDYLHNVDWAITPGLTNRGQGELVFASQAGVLAVVETKYLDSKTLLEPDEHEKFKERAAANRDKFATKHPEAVAIVLFTCTNKVDGDLEVVPVDRKDRLIMEAVRDVVDRGIRPAEATKEHFFQRSIFLVVAILTITVVLFFMKYLL